MKKHIQKVQRKQLAAFGALSVVAGSASAVVPAEATAVFTELTADATTLIGAGWAVFAVVIGGLALFSILRKVVGRAT